MSARPIPCHANEILGASIPICHQVVKVKPSFLCSRSCSRLHSDTMPVLGSEAQRLMPSTVSASSRGGNGEPNASIVRTMRSRLSKSWLHDILRRRSVDVCIELSMTSERVRVGGGTGREQAPVRWRAYRGRRTFEAHPRRHLSVYWPP